MRACSGVAGGKVSKDDAKSIAYYTAAANTNSTFACLQLASKYYKGTGVKKNPKEVRRSEADHNKNTPRA